MLDQSGTTTIHRGVSIESLLLPELESPLIRSIRELVDAIAIEANERTHPADHARGPRADAVLVSAAFRRVRSSRRVTFAGTQARPDTRR
jgi:hypothetical protein